MYMHVPLVEINLSNIITITTLSVIMVMWRINYDKALLANMQKMTDMYSIIQ